MQLNTKACVSCAHFEYGPVIGENTNFHKVLRVQYKQNYQILV